MATKSNSKEKNIQRENKQVSTPKTFEEEKDYILGDFKNMYSADKLLKKLLETPKSKVTHEELKKEITKILIALELDSHVALSETTSEKYQILVVEFCKQIIEEYSCRTPSEKALAEVIAGAFVRQLRCAKRLEDGLGSDNLNYYTASTLSIIGKELDRATRTFVSTLSLLKQIKSPTIDIKIKTNTAFVANNQQINVSGVKKDENIKPI